MENTPATIDISTFLPDFSGLYAAVGSVGVTLMGLTVGIAAFVLIRGLARRLK